MEGFFKIAHGFNSGDLITVLPGLKNLYKETGKKSIIYQRLNLPANYDHKYNHPIKSKDGVQVCMNEETFWLMKPLIESQEYIEGFEKWDGQKVDFDIDESRIKNPSVMSGGLIHYWPVFDIPQLACDLSKSWLGISAKQNNTVCINLTERYRNPKVHYLFLSEYKDEIVFVGLKHEHEIFCKKWGIDVSYHEAKEFYHLAQIIKGCRFFIGNQSFCWHLADAMKVQRILEVCYDFPNTFPTGANGYAFTKQEGLEYYFNKLLKDTE